MLNPSFNRNIKAIIKKLNFPVYAVVLDRRYKCTCVDMNNQPDPACMKCLGTGYHIKIRKTLAAMEPDDVSVRLNGASDKVASNYYYFDADTVPADVPQTSNIIVRDNEVDVLLSPKLYRSDSNKVIYYYCEAVNKKTNYDIFLSNFWKLVRKK